ncbi:MAG: sugar phosphate isomerase/epimerase [Rhodoglobus sp.]
MIRIGMSTSCVYPLSTEDAFRLAKAAGFDGMEVMITNDPTTQDAAGLSELSRRYELPILSVHAPVLLLTQFVWGIDPIAKLERSAELAVEVGAPTVVVHPPFRWQAGYARNFEKTVRRLSATYGLELAVENMFPWKIGPATIRGYSPSPDPVLSNNDALTLDFSHASLGGRDSLEFAMSMGDRLRHVHLCDGPGSMAEGYLFDEHRVPGHGTQPVGEVIEYLAGRGWNGSLIAEVNTRSAHGIRGRLAMLVETRAFAQRHLAAAKPTRPQRARSESA